MNKKRFYIVSSTLLLIGLFAGVVQYVGMFDALYAAAVNPGHSWSQMECSTALCIDTTNNRVGVGTMTPSQKLTVNGIVESTTGGIKFPDGTIQTTKFSSSECFVVTAEKLIDGQKMYAIEPVCPAGTHAVGGGRGEPFKGGIIYSSNGPKSDLSGWICLASLSGSGSVIAPCDAVCCP